jgi:D-alanine-D-alanine ligase
VLLGGPSAEREVSLVRNGVLAALRDKGVDAHPLDPAQRDLFGLKRGFARASSRCMAVSARTALQGALETLGIPYTGSGVMASALAPTNGAPPLAGQRHPHAEVPRRGRGTDWMRVVAELGLPLIVKPAREGSTIGITKVAKVDHDELALAYAEAASTTVVLVENSSPAPNSASIVNGRALP